MAKQTNEDKRFLECANKASRRIIEINRILGGEGCMEAGSLFGDVYYTIADMIEIYLAPIVKKEINSDELNDMTTEIMYAEQDEIESIIKKYNEI